MPKLKLLLRVTCHNDYGSILNLNKASSVRVVSCVCVSSLLSLQNKLKKIKEKYKDQDEEDRELRMQLLGVRRLSLCNIPRHRAICKAFSRT